MNYTFGDDGGSGIRSATATQTLSPQQQALYELATQAETGLGQLANSQIGQARQSLGTPFSIASALRQNRAIPASDQRSAAIEQMYGQILNRRPDTEGLNYWLNSPQSLEAIQQQFQTVAANGSDPLAMAGGQGGMAQPQMMNNGGQPMAARSQGQMQPIMMQGGTNLDRVNRIDTSGIPPLQYRVPMSRARRLRQTFQGQR